MFKDKNPQLDIQNPSCGMQLAIYDGLIELCLVFLIIFTPLVYGAIEPWGIAVFEVTAGFMAFIWFLKMLSAGKFEFVRNPLTLFVFLFIFYIFLQWLLSRYSLLTTIYPWATKTELLKVISYALIFFVGLNTITTKRKIIRILSIVIAMGFFMSIFFLMRYFGLKAPRGLINPDHFSAYLGMIIPLTLGFLFIHPMSDKQILKTEQRILLFFTVIIMGAALFFTMSRGGMFSFTAALLSMAILVLIRKSVKGKRWILSAVTICIVLIIAWLGATPVVERILSVKAEIASRYFGGRLPIWQGTAQIIKDYLIFGTGLGTFSYIFPNYQPQLIATKHYTYAHSDFLELLSEVGIVGFSIFLLGLIVFIIYAFRRFRLRHDPYVIGMSIGLFGSLTSIFMHSFTDFNLHIPANAILLTLILSLFIIILNYKQNGALSLHNTQYEICPLSS